MNKFPGPETAQKKRPESVLVLVATHSGLVLLLERTYPIGFWQSVTGSLEWDEDPEAAAKRELAEETGIVSDQIRNLKTGARFRILPEWRARFAPGTYENKEHWFRLWINEPVQVDLNPTEHIFSKWIQIHEAISAVSSWSNRIALEKYILPYVTDLPR